MKNLLVLAPLAIALVAACGGGPAAPTAGSPAPTAASPAPTAGSPAPTEGGGAAVSCLPGESSGDASVDIVDFAFEPAQLTVSAGQTVAWTNNGAVPHTVTFDEGTDCGRLSSGDSVAATFGEAGEYPYICTIHPQMTATITVEP